MTITQSMVRAMFDYDPTTGALVRLFKNGKRKPMRLTHGDGSVKVRIMGKDYRAHRIIWLHAHGRLPVDVIDHINGNPSDNRLANLREATDAENKRNVGKRRHNTSGFKGVTWDKANKRWLAHATYNGKGVHLGRHPTKEQAAQAYETFARQHYGEFYRSATP